ncbi:hypothetical protein HG531_013861 [Fusarium graminearum]|nr:hypothetical protein HG531_013861 [Fusarium graminearum]
MDANKTISPHKLIFLAKLISRSCHLHFSTVNLDDVYQWKDEKEHGEKLSETPDCLALVFQLDGWMAKCLGQQNDSNSCANSDGCHQNQPGNLDSLVEPLLFAVEVPSSQTKDDAVAGDDDDCPNIRQSSHRRSSSFRNALKNKHTGDARQRQVDEHKELSHPSNHPVAAVILLEGQQCCVVGRHGKERQHPDEEEMIRHETVHLGEPNTLDANSLHNLRVAVAVEQLPSDDRLFASHLGEDDTTR